MVIEIPRDVKVGLLTSIAAGLIVLALAWIVSKMPSMDTPITIPFWLLDLIFVIISSVVVSKMLMYRTEIRALRAELQGSRDLEHELQQSRQLTQDVMKERDEAYGRIREMASRTGT